MKKATSLYLTLILSLSQTVNAADSATESSFRNIHQKLSRTNYQFESLWYIQRKSVPLETRTYIDTWVLQNPQLKIDQIDIVPLKCGDNKKESCFRILTKINKKQLIIEFNDSSKQFATINGIKLDAKQSLQVLQKIHSELATIDGVEQKKLLLSRSPLSLSKNEASKMTARESREQILNIRLLIESSKKIHDQKALFKKSASLPWWLESAYASEDSPLCLTKSGYISKLEESKCVESSEAKSACAIGQFSCNPQIYGANSGGAPYCRSAQESCEQISPLRKERLKEDSKKLLKSLENAQISNFTNENDYARYINEASVICENQNPLTKECKELLQRRANYNSYLMDLKVKIQDHPEKATLEKTMSSSEIETIASANESESCGWWCRNQSWALPVSIVGGTIVGMVAICKFTSFKLLGICGDKDENDDSSSDSASNPVEVLEAPTSADYTTGIR